MPRKSRKAATWNPPSNPNETPLYAWRADRRATRKHVRAAVLDAIEQRAQVAALAPEWSARASGVSCQWADKVRRMSLKQLARSVLEYRRYRAHMGLESPAQGSHVPAGWPLDGPEHRRWKVTNDLPLPPIERPAIAA